MFVTHTYPKAQPFSLTLRTLFLATLAHINYREFHGFGQAKFPNCGWVLGSSQFSILPQLPQKTMLGLKGVKID